MNADCLANILNFMPASKVVRLTKETAIERFPTKLVLTGTNQIDQFNRWCRTFDTSRLEEVHIDVPMKEFTIGRNFLIGSVPPSVKRLTIHDDNFSMMVIPPTVEVLMIEKSQERHIVLPDGIKTLILGKAFHGTIRIFPATLETLVIHCWDYPFGFDANSPDRLRNIPDTVHTIEIGEAAPVVVGKWPANIQKIILPKIHWGVHAWLEHDHAEIPDVEVIHKSSDDLPLLVQQYNDPVQQWWSDEDELEWEQDYDY